MENDIQTTYVFVRHASAERTEPDKDRRLSLAGVREANQTRTVLERLGYLSSFRTIAVCSNTPRAEATARILKPFSSPILHIEDLYTRGWEVNNKEVARHIRNIAERNRVKVLIVVGHGETLNWVVAEFANETSKEILKDNLPNYAEGFIVNPEGEVSELKRK